MTDWTFEVAGDPPSVNDTYRIVYVGTRCPACGRGPARLGKAAGVETWQEAVAWSAKSARPSGWLPARRTIIEIRWFTSRAGRDADNPIKALLDGIKVGLGCDDKGFLPRVEQNEKDARSPRTEVTIRNAP